MDQPQGSERRIDRHSDNQMRDRVEKDPLAEEIAQKYREFLRTLSK
jgi:hypothetical protein